MDEEWWTYWIYEVSLCITIYIYVPLSRSEHWYFRKVARRPQGTKYFSYPTCQWLFWWKLKQIYTHLLHMPFLPRTPRPLQFPDVGSWCLGKWTSAIEHKCAKSTMFKILDGVELGRPFWSVIPREGPLDWQKNQTNHYVLGFLPHQKYRTTPSIPIYWGRVLPGFRWFNPPLGASVFRFTPW